MDQQNPDILIVGGGPVGLCLALALKQGGLAPLLVDARPAGAAADDPRILALSHSSRQVLERLGIWRALAPTAINQIHISQRGGFGRTRLDRADYRLPALGYVQEAGALAAALDQACDRAGVVRRYQTRLDAVTPSTDGVALSLTGPDAPQQLAVKLVANAEGRIAPGQDVYEHDYGQHAVITVAQPALPHGNLAYERFTPDGPLALLPCGPAYAVVFTATPEVAEQLLALDERAFLDRLQAQFGRNMAFTAAGPRASYPLLLRYRKQPVAQRQVWLGNAAQTLHPVAGQGFNLAARDVWQLADLLLKHSGPGFDAGSPALLASYAARRQVDRRGTIGFTNSLVQTFSNADPALGLARGAALLALDLLPPLRDFIARRMLFGARAWP